MKNVVEERLLIFFSLQLLAEMRWNKNYFEVVVHVWRFMDTVKIQQPVLASKSKPQYSYKDKRRADSALKNKNNKIVGNLRVSRTFNLKNILKLKTELRFRWDEAKSNCSRILLNVLALWRILNMSLTNYERNRPMETILD